MTNPMNPTHPTSPDGPNRFIVRQRITMMVNRYEVHAADATGAEGPLVAFAQQKRLAFKEEVTFSTDETRATPVFSFKSRQRLDLGATYDVKDADGRPIGWFKKAFGQSLLRSTWELGADQGFHAVGTERNQTIAVLRRLWNVIPIVNDLPCPFLFHFDFRMPDGRIAMTSQRRRSLRDVYDVDLPVQPDGSHLDWRLGAAMAVALDALQSR